MCAFMNEQSSTGTSASTKNFVTCQILT